MNAIVSFKLCTLSDTELLDKVDKMTDDIFKYNKIPNRHIPARPNKDYDLLVGELIRRFCEMIKEKDNYLVLRDYVSCPNCKSTNIVTDKGYELFNTLICKDCKHKFKNN